MGGNLQCSCMNHSFNQLNQIPRKSVITKSREMKSLFHETKTGRVQNYKRFMQFQNRFY